MESETALHRMSVSEADNEGSLKDVSVSPHFVSRGPKGLAKGFHLLIFPLKEALKVRPDFVVGIKHFSGLFLRLELIHRKTQTFLGVPVSIKTLVKVKTKIKSRAWMFKKRSKLFR
ncbi:hypothetical protein [Thermosulfurimonas sp. F29]|uniref:hypothetical protein n=1 Tax=Thermosulfurimonas sp. F29 TaxID=2867247 RepID=UPI001C83C4A4|nr:hypothetical protein [Thermosulfurimonas sp. F29]MBX6423228.1 hypothetical protein [Thermosulfurimonas sp. F29]